MSKLEQLLTSPQYARLCRLSGSLNGADRIFMLLQYTAGIVGNLAAKGALPLSLVAIKKLDIIKGKLSEWRTIGRFLGLLEMARWGFSLSKKSSWIEWAQWASITAYYPFEHATYLASIGVISVSPGRRAKLGLYSVRCWAFYLVLEIFKLSKQLKIDRKLRSRLSATAATTSSSEPSKDKPVQVSMSPKQKAVAESSLYHQLAYFPMSIHWAVPGGVLPQSLSDIFPVLAAVYGFQKAWITTA